MFIILVRTIFRINLNQKFHDIIGEKSYNLFQQIKMSKSE